jgi:N-acetylmuramoyl-L-alanine amidase
MMKTEDENISDRIPAAVHQRKERIRSIQKVRYVRGIQLSTATLLLTIATAISGTFGSAKTSGPSQTVIDTIIIHAVSGPSCIGGRVAYSGAPGNAGRWKRFFDRHPFLGIHYVVDRAGTVLASTPENQVANHALGHNYGTIGIELVNEGNGIDPFTERQIEALIELIKTIRTRHDIPVANIKGHADVDSRTFLCGGRLIKGRVDPGANFPWAKVRASLSP